MNPEQTVGMVATQDDVMLFNLGSGDEIDCDDLFEVGDIKAIKYYDNKFYVLANKFRGEICTVLFSLDENFDLLAGIKYILKLNMKLPIDDAYIYILEDQDTK